MRSTLGKHEAAVRSCSDLHTGHDIFHNVGGDNLIIKHSRNLKLMNFYWFGLVSLRKPIPPFSDPRDREIQCSDPRFPHLTKKKIPHTPDVRP